MSLPSQTPLTDEQCRTAGAFYGLVDAAVEVAPRRWPELARYTAEVRSAAHLALVEAARRHELGSFIGLDWWFCVAFHEEICDFRRYLQAEREAGL